MSFCTRTNRHICTHLDRSIHELQTVGCVCRLAVRAFRWISDVCVRVCMSIIICLSVRFVARACQASPALPSCLPFHAYTKSRTHTHAPTRICSLTFPLSSSSSSSLLCACDWISKTHAHTPFFFHDFSSSLSLQTSLSPVSPSWCECVRNLAALPTNISLSVPISKYTPHFVHETQRLHPHTHTQSLIPPTLSN